MAGRYLFLGVATAKEKGRAPRGRRKEDARTITQPWFWCLAPYVHRRTHNAISTPPVRQLLFLKLEVFFFSVFFFFFFRLIHWKRILLCLRASVNDMRPSGSHTKGLRLAGEETEGLHTTNSHCDKHTVPCPLYIIIKLSRMLLHSL